MRYRIRKPPIVENAYPLLAVGSTLQLPDADTRNPSAATALTGNTKLYGTSAKASIENDERVILYAMRYLPFVWSFSGFHDVSTPSVSDTNTPLAKRDFTFTPASQMLLNGPCSDSTSVRGVSERSTRSWRCPCML